MESKFKVEPVDRSTGMICIGPDTIVAMRVVRKMSDGAGSAPRRGLAGHAANSTYKSKPRSTVFLSSTIYQILKSSLVRPSFQPFSNPHKNIPGDLVIVLSCQQLAILFPTYSQTISLALHRTWPKRSLTMHSPTQATSTRILGRISPTPGRPIR